MRAVETVGKKENSYTKMVKQIQTRINYIGQTTCYNNHIALNNECAMPGLPNIKMISYSKLKNSTSKKTDTYNYCYKTGNTSVSKVLFCTRFSSSLCLSAVSSSCKCLIWALHAVT
jgi:hypothetical protein